MFYINVSDNIKLKLLTLNNSIEVFELIKKNKSHLQYYMPRIKENDSIEDTKKVIKLFLNQLIENNGFRAGILYNESLVGVIGMKYIDWFNLKTEIMYWIDKNYLRKGITSSCVLRVIDIAFKQYNLNKVVIKTSFTNKASIKIAEKCGFILEGVCRSDELLEDGYTDVCIYSLLKEDYTR